MMDENDRKERFSLAYISAVAAHTGYHVTEPRVDRDSIDRQILGDRGIRPRIEFQAKATARNIVRGSSLAFPLSAKNYDDLRAEVIVPRLLIVLVVPSSSREWLVQSEQEMRLRRCAYWLSLASMGARPNSTTITVRIPRTQIFDTAQLRGLMERAGKKEPL